MPVTSTKLKEVLSQRSNHTREIHSSVAVGMVGETAPNCVTWMCFRTNSFSAFALVKHQNRFRFEETCSISF